MTPAQFVRSATQLRPAPFVPEVSLHLAADIYALWEQTESDSGLADVPPPFWGFAWPGGQALARYFLDNASLISGRKVVDLGAGSGLVAIAAAKAGAAAVVAAEADQFALAAIELNAAANNVRVSTLATDIATGTADGLVADLVAAGDVWYEKQLAAQVIEVLDGAAAAGADVLAGDIGRTYFPRRRFDCIASYLVPASVELEGRPLITASVWRRTKKPPIAGLGTTHCVRSSP